MQTLEDTIHIRWMMLKDTPQIIHIEQFYQNPWVINDFKKYLKQPKNIGFVAVQNDSILGYSLIQLLPKNFNIHKIAVHPNARRQHVGSLLISKIINKLSMHQRTFINIHVPESNLTAQLFLKSLNFKAKQVVRNFFQNEDSYFMQYNAN